MNQHTFRFTDPPASREAADRMQATGKADSHRRIFYDLVRDNPGRTSKELGRLAAIHGMTDARHEAGRRLPELYRAGLVTNVDPNTGENTRATSGEMLWWEA
jgi:hypothetical protein